MKWENGLNHKNEDLTVELEKAKWLKIRKCPCYSRVMHKYSSAYRPAGDVTLHEISDLALISASTCYCVFYS